MRVQDRGTIELADAADVNKETISIWRGGRQKSYEYDKVARVAAELETTAEELLDLPPVPQAVDQPGPPPDHGAETSQRRLLKRIAELGPTIEGLTELQKVVDEARRLSG